MSVQILLLVVWQLQFGSTPNPPMVPEIQEGRRSKPPKRSLSRVIKNMPKGTQSQVQAEGSSVVELSILRSLTFGLAFVPVGCSSGRLVHPSSRVPERKMKSCLIKLALTQELHLHDARSFNTIQVAYVGIDHAEFGRVVAESQRLIGEADSRASHFEGVAQQVFQEATAHIGYLTSLVEELRSQNEMLQTGHTEKDVMITSLHEAVQEVKQTLENQIKFNQSMFEGQLRKAKDEIDRLSDLNQKSLNLLGYKDSEIQRLCQESSSRQDRISSLEADWLLQAPRSSSRPAPAFVPKPVPDASSPKDTEEEATECWSRLWKLFSHSDPEC